jgi:hypothetical protein
MPELKSARVRHFVSLPSNDGFPEAPGIARRTVE